MKSKLKLRQIQVQSFVTRLTQREKRLAQGGDPPPPTQNILECETQAPIFCRNQTRGIILCTGL